MKIKSIMIAMLAMVSSMSFVACSKDDTSSNEEHFQAIVDQEVKTNKKHDKAILVVAFGSTWQQSFDTFDTVLAEYKAEFGKDWDVYLAFSSAICSNQANAWEHKDEGAEKRDYFAPEYWLTAIGKMAYKQVVVQSLQVIPGEEFAAVVASVKKFMNNGYVAQAHLDDEYLKKLSEDEAIFFGMPLLNDPVADVNKVAEELHKAYGAEAAKGIVAFMGHGNPDTYDTFKANERYTQLEAALQAKNTNYFVGTVDMPDNYKQNVYDRFPAAVKAGKGEMYLHALMSIAGDHAHNDMAGSTAEFWDPDDPESEENSWFMYFKDKEFDVKVPTGANKQPLGLLEIPGILNIWIEHTKKAQFLEDAYHSMYPEE